MNKAFLRTVGMALLALLPAIVASWFILKLIGHARITNSYDCYARICEADFDGDGKNGTLFVDRESPQRNFDSWFVVKDSNQELLRIPRRSLDNSLRTHAAAVPDPNGTRLIIYDHISGPEPPRSLVFTFDGKKLVEVPSTENDEKIFAAIRAADETGTFTAWALFETFIWPLLAGYYLLLALFAWYIRLSDSGARAE